jgi:hypothetical protein
VLSYEKQAQVRVRTYPHTSRGSRSAKDGDRKTEDRKIVEEETKLAPHQPLWPAELAKCEQMDRDMNAAEDLTDDEAEAYERVMQRLSTAT